MIQRKYLDTEAKSNNVIVATSAPKIPRMCERNVNSIMDLNIGSCARNNEVEDDQ